MRLLLNPFTRRVDDARHWRHDAACIGADLDLFFPVGVAGPAQWQIAQARAICARCPVRAQCLEYALSAGEDHGIWGGLTPQQRRELRRGTTARGA